MQVILDDSVVLLVYALMLAVIVALFVAAYFLYKRVKERQAEQAPLNDVAPSDKLTSNQADPVGASKYAKYDN